jgi:hypothetical protein
LLFVSVFRKARQEKGGAGYTNGNRHYAMIDRRRASASKSSFWLSLSEPSTCRVFVGCAA